MLDKKDLDQIQKLLSQNNKTVDAKINKLTAALKREIRKSQNSIIAFFDDSYFDLRKRVERIEEHLKLPPLNN